MIPGALVDELLQGLVIPVDPSRQRLDRLALPFAEQSLQILAAPVPAFASPQIFGELRHVVLQLLPYLRHLPCVHHAPQPAGYRKLLKHYLTE